VGEWRVIFVAPLAVKAPESLARRHPWCDLHLICDNYGTMEPTSSPLVRQWVAAHPRFHLHFTPTSDSWLKLVERWFALISGEAIRRGNFESVARLEGAIIRWLKHWNENAQPFLWTKSVVAIKRSLKHVTAVYETRE
jgi:hypothetical protein